MIKLNEFNNINKAKSKKRVGRGIGSGRGKTSSRGVKGQKARSGVSINGFEGGQQSIVTALPKRGFKSQKKKLLYSFDLKLFERLYNNKKISNGEIINNNLLFKLKLIRSIKSKVKLIGNRKLPGNFTFAFSKFSTSAKRAIEESGGSIN